MEKNKLIGFVNRISKTPSFRNTKTPSKVFEVFTNNLVQMSDKMKPAAVIMCSFLIPHVGEDLDSLYDVIESRLFVFSISEITDDEIEYDCERCGGSGDYNCGDCDGNGDIECDDCEGSGEDIDGDECMKCSGDGNLTCDNCGGSGTETCEECSGTGSIDDYGFEYERKYYVSYNNNLKSKLSTFDFEDVILDDNYESIIESDNTIYVGTSPDDTYKGRHDYSKDDYVFSDMDEDLDPKSFYSQNGNFMYLSLSDFQ